MNATSAKTSSKGSPINWTKVIAEAAAAKAETLQAQAGQQQAAGAGR